MSHLTDDLVPKGPPDLCFDSSAFTRESFSVDQFLQDHRTGGNLEKMRDDLGIYLKVLRSAMIDLINKDYADYVNLSRNLIGLDKAIGNINAPLGQLREELLLVNQYINNAVSEVTEKLERRKALRERKRSLRCLSRAQSLLGKLQILLSVEPLDGNTVERAVAEFSQLQFNSERCFHLMSQQEKQSYKEVSDILHRNVNSLFLESVRSKDSGREDLARSLMFFIKMNKHHHVERFYRQSVVQPALQQLITRESLRSLPGGLPALYDRILSYIDDDMNNLLLVTNDNNKYCGLNVYDFLVRSFWPEVEERLEINLTHIYDAGDPNTFYQRYSETVSFLEEFTRKFRSDEARRKWQSQDNFASFMKKWNIPVYFQIRFQEIVKCLEMSLARGVDESGVVSSSDSSSPWKLETSRVLWNSLIRCWSPGVFLLPIADKFWKLTLQILARYHVWIKDYIKHKVPSVKVESCGSGSSKCLVYLYSDMEVLIKKLPELRDTALQQIPHVSPNTMHSLTRSLEESGGRLSSELGSVERVIVKCVTAKCCTSLRQVLDIPRLYRRTNRDPPSKPCPYVTSLLEPTAEFAKLHCDVPASNLWLQTVFSDLTKQYYKLVSEVLTSVQKTEESLRRLKKARDNRNSALPPHQRTADDDKIRLQLTIDVTAYCNGIDCLGIKKSGIEQLTDLLLLVQATQQI